MLGLGNSLARGGAISSLTNTYSLDFDGSDDYVDVGTAYNGVKSISFFIKVDDVTSNDNYVLGLTDSIYVKVTNATVSLEGVSGETIYVDGSEASTIDTDWHHVLITTGTGINASNCDLGRTQSDNAANMLGNLDEVAFTSDVKSASDFADGTTPLDISGLSNLQNWWRMGDGTLDTFPLIADQVNPTLGSDVVTNGGFSADSDWTKGTGWTISGGTASSDGSQGDWSNLAQASILTAGKVYKVQFNITEISAGGFRPTIQTSSTVIGDTYTTAGIKTWYVIATGHTLILQANSSFVGSIDDVSIKLVNGNPGIMTNMVSGDIVEDTP